MKTILRNILSFLDRKWPDKVVVTQTDYDAMLARIKKVEDSAAQYSEARIKTIESEINKFNVHMGFGGTVIPKGMAQTFQR